MENRSFMSSEYKLAEDAIPDFVTFSVAGWMNACPPVGKCSEHTVQRIVQRTLKYCKDNRIDCSILMPGFLEDRQVNAAVKNRQDL
jgi:hypothetical protein